MITELLSFPFTTTATTKFSKGDILLREPQIAQYTYTVIKGCLKSYVVDEDGKEHILQFAPEGWLISDMNSFVNNIPSTITIAAIEDTEVSLFHNKSYKELLTELPREELVELINKLQNSIIAANKRFINMLSSPAEKRYQDFIYTYPGLHKRLPLKLIASYLGIRPESLSRLRKHIATKK